ncbi:MAG: hypothetical protein QOD40_652 [Alphaproteobacteria bacterium]|jgi:hypothetical protein|nr:hypothetical protein [Alphaproteobacteria bacterium]
MTAEDNRPAETAAPAAKRPWTAGRITQLVVGVVLLAVVGLIMVAKFATRNDLPGCDSTRAKDVLSDIFKKNNVDATRYDEIKTLSKSDDEITCYAKLTLRDNSAQEIDYKLVREASDMRLQITRSNP